MNLVEQYLNDSVSYEDFFEQVETEIEKNPMLIDNIISAIKLSMMQQKEMI